MQTTETTVDVRAIKAGLRDLARRMPEQPSVVHEFGALLAAYLNDSIYPSAMFLAVAVFMHDLVRGASGHVAVRIPRALTGLPIPLLGVLKLSIPDMLRAAAGEEHRDVADQLVAALEREPAEVSP